MFDTPHMCCAEKKGIEWKFNNDFGWKNLKQQFPNKHHNIVTYMCIVYTLGITPMIIKWNVRIPLFYINATGWQKDQVSCLCRTDQRNKKKSLTLFSPVRNQRWVEKPNIRQTPCNIRWTIYDTMQRKAIK